MIHTCDFEHNGGRHEMPCKCGKETITVKEWLAQRAANPRRIRDIASEIQDNWSPVYFGAEPYLHAMWRLDTVDDMYGMDDARSIIMYFLSNATTWRGETARRIKAELKAMIK